MATDGVKQTLNERVAAQAEEIAELREQLKQVAWLHEEAKLKLGTMIMQLMLSNPQVQQRIQQEMLAKMGLGGVPIKNGP